MLRIMLRLCNERRAGIPFPASGFRTGASDPPGGDALHRAYYTGFEKGDRFNMSFIVEKFENKSVPVIPLRGDAAVG